MSRECYKCCGDFYYCNCETKNTRYHKFRNFVNEFGVPIFLFCLIFTGVALPITIGSGSSSNLDYVKNSGQEFWKKAGFEKVEYAGYNWGFWGYGTKYGGAKPYYLLKKSDSNLTYVGTLQRWGR